MIDVDMHDIMIDIKDGKYDGQNTPSNVYRALLYSFLSDESVGNITFILTALSTTKHNDMLVTVMSEFGIIARDDVYYTSTNWINDESLFGGITLIESKLRTSNKIMRFSKSDAISQSNCTRVCVMCFLKM